MLSLAALLAYEERDVSQVPPSPDPCVIGSGVLARRRAHEARLGVDVVKRTLTTLPPDLRQEYDDATPISWIRIATVETVSDVMAAQANMDPEAWHDQTVRAGATETFKTVWRVMLRFTSDEALVMRAATMYSKTRNVGQLHARIVQPGRAELTLTEFRGLRPRWARAIAIGTEVVLSLAGREQVSVTPTLQPDGQSFTPAGAPDTGQLAASIDDGW